MTRKALCIGINDYPGTGSDLSGCVNDANDWRATLESYGFIVQQLLNSQATKDAMCQGIRQLVQEARSGDVIVVTYSGHGSWIPDLDGDEPDARDEVLCPYDISQNHPLTDDELYNIFAERARGVHIALISDSCHSGSVIRLRPPPEAAVGQRIRFLAPEQFLPEDVLQVARERASNSVAGIPRPFGGVLFSGCQDMEYSYDAEFDRHPNGAFTYFALKALKTLPADATYRNWYQAIQNYLPNALQPQRPNLQGTKTQLAWKIFGGPFQPLEVNMSKQDKKPEIQRNATGTTTVETPSSPWTWGGSREQQRRTASRPTTESSLIPDGAYVTAAGSSNALFRIQNGRRQPVQPSDVASIGINQNDVQEVDALTLYSIPLAGMRQRAIGRDLQRYLWSNLGAGHFMQSWVWLRGTTLTMRTITETVTWFGGYDGGVSAVLYDASGNRILHPEIKERYGIDGRAFGRGWREDTQTWELPLDVTNAAESILILHYWDPKFSLVASIITVLPLIWEVIKKILEAQQSGESMNAGGEEYDGGWGEGETSSV